IYRHFQRVSSIKAAPSAPPPPPPPPASVIAEAKAMASTKLVVDHVYRDDNL
ncbi:hypothetical protein M0804_015415, partial [Polistes exclamans]